MADELLVGDIVLLKAGQAIPADCLLIEASGAVTVNESCLTGEVEEVIKSVSTLNNLDNHDVDPFLLASTLIESGDC